MTQRHPAYEAAWTVIFWINQIATALLAYLVAVAKAWPVILVLTPPSGLTWAAAAGVAFIASLTCTSILSWRSRKRARELVGSILVFFGLSALVLSVVAARWANPTIETQWASAVLDKLPWLAVLSLVLGMVVGVFLKYRRRGHDELAKE